MQGACNYSQNELINIALFNLIMECGQYSSSARDGLKDLYILCLEYMRKDHIILNHDGKEATGHKLEHQHTRQAKLL